MAGGGLSIGGVIRSTTGGAAPPLLDPPAATTARPVLIDASVWIEALKPAGAPDLRAMVDELVANGRAAVCEVVLAEVLRGARDNLEREALAGELLATTVLSMDGAGLIAGDLALRLRRLGLSISTTDLVIATTASMHRAELFHRDAHLSQAASALGLKEYGRAEDACP